jgi:Stress responsive A/B Barrel Domain
MVRHVFMWRVVPEEDPQKVLDILNTLPDKVPGIRSWEIGSHQGDTGDSGDPWDGVLVTDFDSFAALDEYSAHPYHAQVVEQLVPRFAARAVVDFERKGER